MGPIKINVLAFKKKVGTEQGVVLVTNGLSDHRPPRQKGSELSPYVELCWFTRDVNPAKAKFLYDVATQPWQTKQPIQFGGFISLPEPPVKGGPAKDVTFLHPITMTEKLMHTELALMVGYFDMLVVHLLLPKEYASMKKSERNFDRFLDLLDANNYPLFFDPNRRSYL